MRFAYSWLLDYLDTGWPASAVVDELSRLGIESELLYDGQDPSSVFVVARVDEVALHPSADRLKICKIFDGANYLQVVCAASNVREGMLAVLARCGAVIPSSGLKIAESIIREVKSCGMLCSASELGVQGYGERDSCILDLPDCDYKVGDSFFLPGPIIEVSVTPNRGDCLGLYGIARELAAAGVGVLKPLTMGGDLETFGSPKIQVEMRSKGVFMGRYIRSIKNTNGTPRWIRDRLVSAGIKTVSCAVDIVNYVMLVLNRPMHVYDADKICGGKLIVSASSDANFSALDGKEYALCKDNLVVTDGSGDVHCLAGVVGSKLSECTLDSENIFLESAWYDPVDIVVSSRKIKLSTDSSYRFERFVDPGCVRLGLDFAAHMIIKYCGGMASDVVVCGEAPPENRVIPFHPDSVGSVCSVEIARGEILKILVSLGFAVNSDEHPWEVSVPSWRLADVRSSLDVVEEVLRVYGYDNIQEQRITPDTVNLPEAEDLRDGKLRLSMLSAGLSEVVTWSFMSGAVAAERFGYDVGHLRIENPVSNQFDVMRPTLLPNLLQVVASNQACGCESVAIFELGDAYRSLSGSEHSICGVRSGDSVPRNPHVASRKFDFFDAKCDALQVLAQLGVDSKSIELRDCAGRDYMHPARSADLYFHDVLCGYVGELHPDLISFFEIKSTAVCFEIFVSSVPAVSEGHIGDEFLVHKYQPVKRDFAFVLDKSVRSQTLVDVVSCVPSVEEVAVFDIYSGDNVPEGKVSIAIAVVMSSKISTMTEHEISNVSARIVALVAEKLGGTLRA
ncbi:phenylalanine--tRNA ligase subunit beta [Anaplasma capra]|uniref:phenylalanine--tRNA ligase subunit beta n=1 Tax=Anaplasma capra TaxID=1562740 RepID=UPI0021D5A320|nr:phenylalanine--tRNA ligase subunit beta [Anaplasma capra]MCU7611937.1 phenylalanine--tRNA ligase subunit beta [Anaplasma capra]MCU7612803.1 phenylalanine--tRNA ligase subunit beta [Anaplasma capra]